MFIQCCRYSTCCCVGGTCVYSHSYIWRRPLISSFQTSCAACYGLHITVCMVLLYVLCQPVHSSIEPSLYTSARFSFRDFIMETFFFDKNLNNFVTQAAHTLAVDVLSLHMCTNWLPTASTLFILFLQKKAQAV